MAVYEGGKKGDSKTGVGDNYKTLKTPEQGIKCFNQVKGDRLNWESMWDELAYYVVPLREMYNQTKGDEKYTHLLDTTAMTSCELLAGALHGMLTNPVGYFFSLSTGNKELDDKDAVRLYLQEVTRIIHDVLNQSNFQTEVHEMYLGICGQGNSCMSVEEDPDTDVTFSTKPLKEVWWKENSKGKVSELYRLFKLDVSGLVDEFGLENLPPKYKKYYNENKVEKFEVLHVIYPRKKTAAAKKEFKFEFVSQYILMKDKVNVKIEGFYEFPWLTPRWLKMAGEEYGRGPGEKALGPARALNVMKETTIAAAQKMTDPPLQAPDDGFMTQFNTYPGGMSYYRAGSQDRIEPVFNNAQVDFGFQTIADDRTVVREAFYTDQLKLREGDRMTTVEVNERIEQGLRFMGPQLGRLQSEALVPLVSRTYGILERKDKLPAVPRELNGVPLKIRYSSVMAMQQRQSELGSMRRTMQEAAPFMAINPQLNNLFDGEVAIRHIAKITNFPQEIIRKKDDYVAINEAQAKQQAEMQKAERENVQADSTSKIAGAAAKFQPKVAG